MHGTKYSHLAVLEPEKKKFERLIFPTKYSSSQKVLKFTLPETNTVHENPIFPDKYHQNGGFSMAMLVYRSVARTAKYVFIRTWELFSKTNKCNPPASSSRDLD